MLSETLAKGWVMRVKRGQNSLSWALLAVSWLLFAGICLWFSIVSGLARHSLGHNRSLLIESDSVTHDDVRHMADEARSILWNFIDGPASIAAIVSFVIFLLLATAVLIRLVRGWRGNRARHAGDSE